MCVDTALLFFLSQGDPFKTTGCGYADELQVGWVGLLPGVRCQKIPGPFFPFE